MLIDYHAHVNFSAYKNDADEVIKRAHEAGVFMVLVGSQIDTSRRAVEMAAKYERGVWAAVGLHPIHLEDMEVDEEESHFATRKEVFDSAAYRALAAHEKVVAIGECGLDYFHTPDSHRIENRIATDHGWKGRQHSTLRQHLDLADELDLPLILHCRGRKNDPNDAYRDELKILREYVEAGKLKRRGAIHCFVSTWEIAQQYLELGFYIGFTGVITFPKTEQYAEVVRNTPLERILVETDCPYLAPQPVRGKRNEPLYVRYVAEKVAEIKGVGQEEVERILFENTFKVFPKIIHYMENDAKTLSPQSSPTWGEEGDRSPSPLMGEGRGEGGTWSALSLAWELGYTIAIPIVALALGGRLLDRKFDTPPWFLLTGIFVSLIASSWLVYFKMIKIIGQK